jgi:uncharacterized protein (DUF849 family)
MSMPYLNSDVFITCAVTGAGDSTSKSDKVPVTPKQIADDAIAAAKAGAAVAHIHVRDPETGAPSRKVEYYREVVERVRESDTDVVLNLTTGMGGDLVLGSAEQPLPLNDAETDMAGASERLAHIHALKPEICTLDCGTINFAAGGDYIMTNTPHTVREMARQIRDAGVRPEIEVFDFGQLVLAKDLYKEGLIEDPVLVQLCMGIPYGTPDDPQTIVNLASQIPDDWTYSAFSIGRMQLPYVAMAALAGGNVRVGLEDNIYLQKGVLASNADLVERARSILEAMNVNVMDPARVREKLQLRKAA